MNLKVILSIAAIAIVLPRTAYQKNLAEPIKIAPYGNSITQAYGDRQSYRYPLWKKLIDANIEFDYVGSMNSNFAGNPSRPDYKGKKFDMDHEGHWGWRADEILNKIDGWLSGYTPDMVLFHIGTNDCIQNHSNDITINELTQIVAKLRNDNPEVVIFLANLIPCNESGATAGRVRDLNTKIEPLAKQLDKESSPVIFVDQYAGIQGSDLYDGIHPGSVGEEKMAQKWFDALQKYIQITKLNRQHAPRAVSLNSAAPSPTLKVVCSGKNRPAWMPQVGRGYITDLMGKSVPTALSTRPSNGIYLTTITTDK